MGGTVDAFENSSADIAELSLALMPQARRRIAAADGVSINHFTGRPIFSNCDGAVIAVE